MSDLRFRALDHLFALSAPEPVRSLLADALEPLRVESGPEVATPCEDIVVAETADGSWAFTAERAEPSPMALGSLVARLLEYVNQRAAASLTAEVPLHAAGVRTDGGGVIALAGSSGAGKSTLGAAAMLAGWGFLAEEIAAVDPVSLAVRPYHRPVGLRRGERVPWASTIPMWPTGATATSTRGRCLPPVGSRPVCCSASPSCTATRARWRSPR